jgi:hypothetical protein
VFVFEHEVLGCELLPVLFLPATVHDSIGPLAQFADAFVFFGIEFGVLEV